MRSKATLTALTIIAALILTATPAAADKSSRETWTPNDKFDLYINVDGAKQTSQTIIQRLTPADLEYGDLFGAGPIHLEGTGEVSWNGDPQPTCLQLALDSQSCYQFFLAVFTSKELGYETQFDNRGNALPNFCREEESLPAGGLPHYDVTIAGKCVWYVLLQTPDKFGVFSLVFRVNSALKTAEMTAVAGDSSELGYELGYSVQVENALQPDLPTWEIKNNDFGDVPVFTPKVKKVKLVNTSDVEVGVNSIKIKKDVGDDFDKFGDTGCKPVIEPNSTCEVEVQFFPRNDGPQSAILDFDLDVDQNMEVLLTGMGTYSEPTSDVPDESVVPGPETDPENPRPPSNGDQQVEQIKPGRYQVDSKKNKVTIKFQPPLPNEFTITGYEWRKQRKPNGKWTSWEFVDPRPNKNGWVKFDVPMKKSGCYKIQLRSLTPQGHGPQEQVVVCNDKPVKVPTKPGNG
jgi:hypothetical protein